MKKTLLRLWMFALILSVVCAPIAQAETAGTYEDSFYLRENGEYACDVPYGYLWEIDYIDGTIVGEDVTICTTTDEYNECNPNWAITSILKKQSDGTYVAVSDAIVGSGSRPLIELKEDQIAFVVHSGGSVPSNCLGSYENWVGKVVAVSIKAGDVFEIDLTSNPMTVYAVGPSPDAPPTEKPSQDGLLSIDGKTDDAAYADATWYTLGVWQELNDPQVSDLEIAYATFFDEKSIYVSIKVGNKGVDFKNALDPANWDQSGATNFRIWLKGDGMEARTFYDLLWNGTVFEPFRQKKATEEILYAASYGDDFIVLETKIDKQTLMIEEHYDLMVTYSTPFCESSEEIGYNAFHMTSFHYGEDGKLPAGWSSSTVLYERYSCTKAPSALCGDIDGDGMVKAKDFMMLKRYVLGTFELTEEQLATADIDGNGEVKAKDFMMLKRIVLGTWTPDAE